LPCLVRCISLFYGPSHGLVLSRRYCRPGPVEPCEHPDQEQGRAAVSASPLGPPEGRNEREKGYGRRDYEDKWGTNEQHCPDGQSHVNDGRPFSVRSKERDEEPTDDGAEQKDADERGAVLSGAGNTQEDEQRKHGGGEGDPEASGCAGRVSLVRLGRDRASA